MATLFEGIDLLVDKEHPTMSSLEEDRRKYAEDIKDMGLCINSSHRDPRKAVLSSRARFHTMLDSQSTPSQHIHTKMKSIEWKECGPTRLQLEVPSSQPPSSVKNTPIVGPNIGDALPLTAPSLGMKPKIRRELYGPEILLLS